MSTSFEHVMSQLFQMKQDLIKLHHIYSPESINYPQLIQINTLKKQVQTSKQKLTEFHNQLIKAKQQTHLNGHKTYQENQELLSINEQLVESNEKFRRLFEKGQKEKEAIQEELIRIKEEKKIMENKHAKQIENIKLMHAQQLYILRKKQKKT